MQKHQRIGSGLKNDVLGVTKLLCNSSLNIRIYSLIKVLITINSVSFDFIIDFGDMNSSLSVNKEL